MHHHTELLERLFGDDVTMTDGIPHVADPAVLASEKMDALAREAVFGEAEHREIARWIIWQLGQVAGVRPASIHELYMARGRGEIAGFTVPAINVRGATYDTARAIFRTAKKLDAGAFILEIARSEIVYTDQRPAEYVSVLIAAALREGYTAPLFIQGDHFQVNAKKYKAGPDAEVHGVKELAREAIAAGFYNIDIDTSTLVDLSKGPLAEQQRLNYEVGVDILKFVRSLEPNGVTISTGGEIGEVGTENSTVEELEAFMDGFNRSLPGEMVGLSKISVQSGTSHGGTVLPDGSIADVALDFNTLRDLSKVAREKYGMAGAVQHGASTLPDALFDNFPKVETAEIHLATNFQNMLYDHLPAELRQEIYGWLREHAKDERKEKDTDEQFFYKTRKKALGPFKRQLWDLPAGLKQQVAQAYDRKFEFLFTQLAVGGTMQHVRKHVNVPQQYRPMPGAGEPVTAAAHDDAEAGE